MSTPHDDTEAFLDALNDAEFYPGRYDQAGDRRLERKNSRGHPDLRIRIDYDGEKRPYNLTIRKLDGHASQIIQWESTLSSHVPTKALLALILAA